MAKTRKHSSSKKHHQTLMKSLRKAISRVNKTARIVARTIEKPVLKVTRKGLGIILKPRLNFKRKSNKRNKRNKRKSNKRNKHKSNKRNKHKSNKRKSNKRKKRRR
jgi:hypothetical protein